MKTSLPVLLAIGLLAGSLQEHASAQLVFSENFNSYTAGAPLPSGTAPKLWQGTRYNGDGVSGDSGDTAEIIQDTSNLFGEGTSNNFLTLGASSTSGNNTYSYTNTFSGGQVGQFTFSFDQQSDFSIGGNVGTYGLDIRLNVGGTTAFALGLLTTAAGKEELYGGNVNPNTALGAYSLNTVNTVTIDYNNSTSSASYAGGTLAAGSMNVYLNGVEVGSDIVPAEAAEGAQVNQLVISGKPNFTGSIDLDDITVTAGAPEPSTFGLLLGAACIVVGVGRVRGLMKS